MLPPWDSKYTTNINVEMNYWPAEVTNLSELHEPFLRMVGEVAETGARTAHDMYGARGWMLHHNTDLWRTTRSGRLCRSGYVAHGRGLVLPPLVGAFFVYRR